MQEFTMNHSEADTMLLSLYHQLRVGDYFGTVVINTEDIDVYDYGQSAYVSQKHLGRLLIKRKRSFVDSSTKKRNAMITVIHLVTMNVKLTLDCGVLSLSDSESAE